mgnify:CR=1 FL=1
MKYNCEVKMKRSEINKALKELEVMLYMMKTLKIVKI